MRDPIEASRKRDAREWTQDHADCVRDHEEHPESRVLRVTRECQAVHDRHVLLAEVERLRKYGDALAGALHRLREVREKVAEICRGPAAGGVVEAATALQAITIEGEMWDALDAYLAEREEDKGGSDA